MLHMLSSMTKYTFKRKVKREQSGKCCNVTTTSNILPSSTLLVHDNPESEATRAEKSRER
jgi:hypothetical protein